jgi:hypothetical protein
VKQRGLTGLIVFGAWLFFFAPNCAQSAPQIIQLTAGQLWQRLEFRITNVPAATNPFDPDIIRLDAAFTLPSGKTMTVPAFWYQAYQRALMSGYEQLTPTGAPEWRLRFTPPESGSYSVSLAIRTNGQLYGSAAATNFAVPAAVAPPGSGYVRVAPGQQYFEAGDGQALRLIGENVDWPTTGEGTYQYDTWFAALQAAGENYARLMTTPWSFNLETDSNSLTHYRLDGAWKLDYVLQLAEQRGIFVLLCLDIHAMFQPVPDYWGIYYWPSNPYNAVNGGPCVNQDAFFTNLTARVTYQKRLRYLIARYGYSPKLVAWQLLSEIDNEYAWITPGNVPPWHAAMGDWLHTNDPCAHLVTTSLTGGSDRPEIWSLPQLDFACYHFYGEPFPATRLNSLAQSFHQRYDKPLLIDEFGTSAYGWNRTNDLYLRGFRQGLWGGALGGSVGTAIAWWWEDIHEENVYPLYTALGSILNRTGWGRGAWTNISFHTSGPPATTVGDLIPGGQPFMVTLPAGGNWGSTLPGRLAVPNADAARYASSTLNHFVLGSWFPTLVRPFALSAWLTNSARLVIHLNSVSVSAGLGVRVDGVMVWSTNLPNLDGLNEVNNEYNLDIPIALPSGKHLVEVTNPALGWCYLDWVRLEQVLPATFSGNWLPSPDAIGLRGPRESLLYVIAPGVSFSVVDTNGALPLQQGQMVILTNWPAGRFYADWYDPATGTNAGYSQAATTNGSLTLRLPDFREDLAGIVYPPPVLTATGMDNAGSFRFNFDSETGGRYLIEQSADLAIWTDYLNITNSLGTLPLVDETARMTARRFFRARSTR